MLQRARQDQEHLKALQWVMQLLDRAIAQVENERRAETLRDLLEEARLEIARLERIMGAASSAGGRKIK